MVFVLQRLDDAGGDVVSVHRSLAGAKRRARVTFALRATVWTEHNSHGRCWSNVAQEPRLLIHELEEEP